MQPIDKSLIIIPTYNEIDNIDKMIRAVFVLYPAISILIIDDGSPDGTAQIVEGHQKEFKNLHLLKRWQIGSRQSAPRL